MPAGTIGCGLIFRSIIICSLPGICLCIVCWQCVGDMCNMKTWMETTNATKQACMDRQSCQKVYFEMYSTFQKRRYSSTVRSCARDCTNQDDFKDCTDALRSSKGCILRLCCKDTDLCNTAQSLETMTSMVLTWILSLCSYMRVKL